MKFIVIVENRGFTFWLRGTTWAFSEDRADKFETMAAAIVARAKAKKFMAPGLFERSIVMSV